MNILQHTSGYGGRLGIRGGHGSLCPLAILLSMALVASPAMARPFSVLNWNQNHDFSADFDATLTDLFSDGSEVVQLTYSQLPGAANIWRGAWENPVGVWQRDSVAYDWVTGPAHDRFPFNNADYNVIRQGIWHCAPTSFGMAHNYWWNNTLNEISTISTFALSMDTDDVNRAMNNGVHTLHYGTYIDDQVTGVSSMAPGAPWPGNYVSGVLWQSLGGANPADRTHLFGEIRAGRPTKVGIEGHATLGVDFDPAAGARVNDPGDGTTKIIAWGDVRNFVSMQPQKLPDLAPGNQVYFSNDNFGTGQANAQAPAGDAGDVFGSSRGGTYGRVLDDVPAGLSKTDATHPDYNAGPVTSGLQHPFDMGDFDVLKTLQPMRYLVYSQDHGDPNPHHWVPGVDQGNPAHQPQELYIRYTPTPWFTQGGQQGELRAVDGTEEQLGVNRGEFAVGGPLDDDVDGVELEFDKNFLVYCVDYVDTRVFPEYAATHNANWLLQDPFWSQLAEYDPTDVYMNGTLFTDGETTLALSDGTQLDAIQYIWDKDGTGRHGLLYSVNALGDAPDCRDSAGNLLNPGEIYLSWLDGQLPIPYLDIGGDVDAITWAGMIPEPSPFAVALFGALLLRICGKRAPAPRGKQ
jgi:hypothetical protein